jgi:hypothetical protein
MQLSPTYQFKCQKYLDFVKIINFLFNKLVSRIVKIIAYLRKTEDLIKKVYLIILKVCTNYKKLVIYFIKPIMN